MNQPIYQSHNKTLARILRNVNISGLLYTVVALLVICVIATFVSRRIMNQSLEQQKTAEHVMFEITYGHNFIVRDVDVTMRGFGIIHDERYLYRSNEYMAIDLENNFHRLDSLLADGNYTDPKGIEAIEKYKYYIRTFVKYHRKMTELIRNGETETFIQEFERDSSATMWPVFTRAVEEVTKHERALSSRALARYNFFSWAVVYVQVLTLLVTIPLVFLIFSRLKNERRTAKILQERKLADERNKTKENMLSVMSHEIRTPLNSMIGLTHVLKRRNPRSDQIDIIDTLKTSGDHLLHLVNDVLDYNKIQANKLDMEILSFNLPDTLKELHTMFARAAEEKGIAFTVQMSPGAPTIVKGDSTRLVQILSNLISNAIKFTTVGSVNLYARQLVQSSSECMVEFRVEDTGIGIPPEKLHLLYEPFTQLETQTRRTYGGSGLGLLIVKNLVEAMKGTVQVTSEPGKTTAVIVSIPFLVESYDIEPLEQSDEHPFHNLKGVAILYVEDVESNQFLLQVLLADYQIDCSIAKDGREALSKMTTQKYDIILLDIQLPDVDGSELAAKIRHDADALNSQTPIILFSAHTGFSEEKIRSCGANDFLRKPFLPEDLIMKIEQNLKRNT
jgi:signal transduction histidine kinase